MALLHYRISHFGSHWLLSCENVPIEVFPTQTLAQRCAKKHIELANRRGDVGTIEVEEKPQNRGKHCLNQMGKHADRHKQTPARSL